MRGPDVTIVGGGPSGAALAIVLGRRGARVLLYEKARHPRLKPCGEGLLPHGVAALREIAGLPEAPRIKGLRFVAGNESVVADFPGDPGLVVRRDRFDAWLFERAASTPNVDARPGVSYRPGPTRFLVGADGIHSRFHRRLPGRSWTPRRVGLSTHLLGLEGLGDRVEVFFHDEGELYIAPTGGGEALVSALLDYGAATRDGLTRLLKKTRGLRDRLPRLELTTPMLASAPLGLHVPRIIDPVAREGEPGKLLLIGDAAGAADPIAAGGLALAFMAVVPAADAITCDTLEAYQRHRLAMQRRARRWSQLMLWLGQSERRAAWVLRHMAWIIPPLLDSVLGGRMPSTPRATAPRLPR